MRLSGRVSVVTGAAAGLGRAIAGRFAHEGAIVVAADTNGLGGAELVQELERDGCEVIFIQTDVSNECEVKRLFDEVKARYQGVDVLYNNAAVLLYDRDSHADQLSVDAWDYVMSVNLRGSFLCMKYAVPSMLERGGGSIVFMGSPTGLCGCAPNLTAYSTSKAAVMGLARVAAAGYASKNIRVNAIVPGTMDTPMNHGVLSSQEARSQYSKAVPLGRLGTPQDIEGLAVFLASDDSAYCTGGLYMCDGGLTAV